MNIVCASDDNYVQHCGVMLTSLFENNKGEEIHIYILTEGLSNVYKERLESIVSKYKGYFHYCQIDGSILEKCPVRKGDHVNIASYYRILVASVLPSNVYEVLYLDCDIVVRKSIKDLFSINIEDKALAAVDELSACYSDSFVRLQYPSSFGYFNAGVILINLKYWRDNNVEEKLLDYIKKNSARIIFHDQDTLNAVLYGQWCSLSPTWNMIEAFYRTNIEPNNLEINALLKKPAILHYSGRWKPWDIVCRHPFKDEYFKYLALAGWRNSHSKFDELVPLCKTIVKEMLCMFGFRQSYYKKYE